MGDAKAQVRRFPAEVKKDIGVALFDAQKGEKSGNAKPFKGIGSGVFEIVTPFDTNTYRAVYAVKIGKEVYVLHAFQKKSSTGIKTAKKDVNLIKKRYKDAVELEKEKRHEQKS
jgi:phage-related protein